MQTDSRGCDCPLGLHTNLLSTALFPTKIDDLSSKYLSPPVGFVKGKTSRKTFLTIPPTRWVCHIAGKDKQDNYKLRTGMAFHPWMKTALACGAHWDSCVYLVTNGLPWLQMLATCWRHVGDKAKYCQFLSRQANFCDMVYTVSAHFCVAISQH